MGDSRTSHPRYTDNLFVNSLLTSSFAGVWPGCRGRVVCNRQTLEPRTHDTSLRGLEKVSLEVGRPPMILSGPHRRADGVLGRLKASLGVLPRPRPLSADVPHPVDTRTEGCYLVEPLDPLPSDTNPFRIIFFLSL